ncbi:VOC family protein [Aureimonas psammosilenae]|uniref:VOC family protein n=1 Tax=Aureimonas psammosilenae TaxID=2495496 RepID=UPI0012610F9A|nr:VOC family protein [Aureimonas psammosilenae]
MFETALLILYVNDPAASARFYRNLLREEPVEQSPTFAMFRLSNWLRLGLWSRHTVEPPAQATGGGAELAILAEDVEAVHADCSARGVPIAQPPADLDFGRSFVANDPDGHRIRVYRPNAR